MPEPQQSGSEQPWDAVAAARTKFPGLANEPDEKIGGFLSNGENFRSSFPEYGHLDDQTIHRNIAARMVPTEKQAAATPAVAPQPAPKQMGPAHHATDPNRGYTPEKSAFQAAAMKEAGGPLGIPAVVGARSLESFANKKDEESLRTAARPRTPQNPVPAEAEIAHPGTAQNEDQLTPFLARSGADALRTAAGALTPTSLGIATVGPLAPTFTGGALALHGAKNAIENAPAAFHGNPEATRNMLNAAAEATGGAAMGREGIEAGAPDVKAAIKPFQKAAEAPGAALRTMGIIKPEPAKALTQAIQPGVNIPFAGKSIEIAGPRIQQLKTAGAIVDEEGNPLTEIKGNKDLLQAVKAGKRYVWDGIEKRTGSVDQLQASTSEVGQAMRKSISTRTREQFPELAQKIEARAKTYDGLKSLRAIEDAIEDANGDLRNFYKRSSPTDSPITSETAATEAEVRSLRKLLDDKVQKLTGAGVKDLKREYGALRDVERAAAKQHAIETRQKGASLWEGLAALRAAGDFVSGNVLGAAKASATLAVGRRLKLFRDPSWLVDQAFQGPKAFNAAAEIAHPPGPNIRGLLPRGPIEVGPAPDRSGPVDLGKPFVHEPDTSRMLGPGNGQMPRKTGPNEPPIDAEFKDIPFKSNAGVTEIPPRGRTLITPRPPVEAMPGAPELPAGPEPQRQLSGPQQRKALNAANPRNSRGAIEVGPSGLPEPPAKPQPSIWQKPTAEFGKKAIQAARETPTVNLTDNEVKHAESGFTPSDEAPKAASKREPREQLQNFSPETLQEARDAVETAHDMWRQFERPGRYVVDTSDEANYGSDMTRTENSVYSIQSARPHIEQAHPWLKNLPKMTPQKLRAAVELGRGVEYNRLLNEAGKHIQAVKDANAPVVDEFRDQLERAAKNVESIDPYLARTLRGIIEGKYSSWSDLSSYAKDKLNEADAATAFDKAIADATAENSPEGGEEPSTESPQASRSDQQTQKLEGVLPGMENAVAENKAAAGKLQGEKMTEAMRAAGKNISEAAGEMETKSPLFRGSAASPQNEMFSPGGAAPDVYQRAQQLRNDIAEGETLLRDNGKGMKPAKVQWIKDTIEDARKKLAALKTPEK